MQRMLGRAVTGDLPLARASLVRAVLVAIAASGFAAARAAAQCNLQELYAPLPVAGDRFGIAVEIQGDRMAIGARGRDGPGGSQGAVFMFEMSSSAWTQAAELFAADGSGAGGGDRFGQAVALEPEWVAIGAPGDGDPNQGISDHGSVYLFAHALGSGWTELQKLTASDLADGRVFGAAVAGASDRLLVGAPGPAPSHPGSAYVFEEGAGVWNEVAILTPSVGSAGDQFGHAVALEDDVAVVAAPFQHRYMGSGFHWRGVVYVFERSGTSWIETAALVSPQPNVDHSLFGWSVAIDDGRVLVGQSYLDSTPREIIVFEDDGTEWRETGVIAPAVPQTASQFGQFVAISGGRVAALGWGGVVGVSDLYVFERGGAEWEQVNDVRLLGAQTGSSDTRLLAIDGDWLALGSPFDDQQATGAGMTSVLSIPDGTASYCYGSGCPCGNDDPLAGCSNSTGVGALLEACGSVSTATDDLVLRTSGLPKNQSCIVFMGGGALENPFGDGTQCVGGGGSGIYRFNPPQSSGGSGTVVLGPGIVARSQAFAGGGHIDPGETWRFQTWYRDPMGSPCGSPFNLSNAVSATFVP